jgi:hypothetical protein
MLQLIGLVVAIITGSLAGSPAPVTAVIVGVSGGGPVGRPHPPAMPTPPPIAATHTAIVQR